MRTNQNGRDPTQTLTLRSDYETALQQRWSRVIALLRQTILDNDALGLRRPSMAIFQDPQGQPANDLGLNETDAAKLAAFLVWFRSVIDAEVLGIRSRDNGTINHTNWQKEFITDAYTRGLAQANIDLRGAGVNIPDLPSTFTNPESLLLIRPIHHNALTLEEMRLFNDLEGIVGVVLAQSQRLLAEGLNQGQSPKEVFEAILGRLEKIGITRSNVLADTAVIGIFANALLNRFLEMGVEEVVVDPGVIFTTVDDDDVCVLCRALEGKRFTIEEARGVIPVHGRCRCSWTPAPEFVANADSNGNGRSLPTITFSELGYLESKLDQVSKRIPTINDIEDSLFSRGWNRRGEPGRDGTTTHDVIPAKWLGKLDNVKRTQRDSSDALRDELKSIIDNQGDDEQLFIAYARDRNGRGLQRTQNNLPFLGIVFTDKPENQLIASDYTWIDLKTKRGGGGSNRSGTTISITSESLLPSPDENGCTPLEAGFCYRIATPISIDSFILPSGGNVCIFSDGVAINPVFFTGSGPAFRVGKKANGDDGDFGSLTLDNMLLIGNGTQLAFDSTTFKSALSSSTLAANFSSFRSFAGMGGVNGITDIAFLTVSFNNYGTGWDLQNVTNILSFISMEYTNEITSNSPIFSLSETFDQITFTDIVTEPNTGESVYDIDSGVTVNVLKSTNTFTSKNGGVFFEPGSLDESDKRFEFGGINVPNSTIFGELFNKSNTTPTVISVADTYTPIGGTLVSGFRERLDQDGNSLQVEGFEDQKLIVSAEVRIENVDELELETVTIAIFYDNGVTNVVIASSELPAVMSPVLGTPFVWFRPSGLVGNVMEDDKFEIQIKVSDTINVLASYIKLRVTRSG